jgi:hypothetical protein
VDLTAIKESLSGLSPQQRRELLAWLKKQDSAANDGKPNPARNTAGAGLEGPARAVAGTLIGLILFACVEAAIFRSGWYSKYLEPYSMAGQVEYNLFWLQRARRPKVPDIAIVGDSRMAEGFSARAANEAAGGAVHFTHLGISGTMPRVWYYLLRDADKNRNRFAAIVIPFDHYSDFDPPEEFQNRENDFAFLSARLNLSDCWGFSQTFLQSDLRHRTFTECLIRGLAMRPDVQAFLANIPDRLKRAKDWRNQGAIYINDYAGKPEDLKGLTFNPSTKTVHFPPGARAGQIDTARATLMPALGPQTGAVTAYRRQWIGGILDLYKNSSTQIIFIRIPNAPLPITESTEPERFIDSVRSRPRLTVLPAGMFVDLERPELFADGLHLNHEGRLLFSGELAKAVAPIVTGDP